MTDIQKVTAENTFRKVLFTASNSQLVVLSLKPGEAIGMESNGLNQFIKIDVGNVIAVLDGTVYAIKNARRS